MKNREYPTERKLWKRLLLILVLYALIGMAAAILLDYILEIFPSPAFLWIGQRIDAIYILYVILGFIGIFYYYWNKPWMYLDEIIRATGEIYEQNSQPIVLSESLRPIESQMNQIKMSVLLNKQAAREAEDKQNELVMYLAHDIRTPLTTVIGYLSLLSEAPDMPPEQKKKYTEIALNKAERLEKLINELFEITRFRAKTVSLKMEKLDLYCLLAQLADEFYPTVSARGNTIRLDAEENITVIADPEKLARVFTNILKNAVSYSYPDTEIRVMAKKEDNMALITIQNHGPDIPKEQLSAIFEKFTRLDEARLSDTGGSGLGLSIAEEILRLHGGDIKAKSGDETVAFIIRLPLPA